MPKRALRIAVALTALCLAPAFPARAQVSDGALIHAKPLKTKKPKTPSGKFEVLRMTGTGIQVRSLANEREIHTFTYSEQIRDKMLALLEKGGYQFGDKVEIEYEPGTQVALKIKGKPSKPI